jgi:1-acyl-sn-glycerol-3-phosphate acyltransferase
MLAARKNPLMNWLIYRLVMKAGLRSSFHAVRIRQAEAMPPPSAPMILFGNHSAWWDAHLPMAANEERWHAEGYVMVEDTQLERYQFFRYCGAFSVNRRDPRSAMLSLNYAVDMLTSGPRRMLLIFPQGEILANDVRPLRFQQGTGHIVKKVLGRGWPCWLYPMALRYEFIGEQKPDAFISVGPALRFEAHARVEAGEVTERLQQALTAELDRLHEDVVAYRFDDFTPLISGAWSINRAWDAVRGKRQIRNVGDHVDEHASQQAGQAPVK